MPWIRSGECNQCGECCKGDPNIGLPCSTINDKPYCPFAEQNADKTIQCTGRTSAYYLQGCNIWPSVPDHIADKPNCSYVFTWVE